MKSSPSYESCLNELGAHGRGPRAGARRVVEIRRADGTFAKSFTGSGAADAEHAALVARVRGHTPAGRKFAKAAAEMDVMCKSLRVRPIVIDKRDLAKAPAPAEIVAKAFGALQHDPGLNAAQRGEIMLGLASLADGVLVKSHPLLGDLDKLQAQLDAALAEGHAGDAEPLIREARALIGRGNLTAPDHARLSLLLNEIKSRLSDGEGADDDQGQ